MVTVPGFHPLRCGATVVAVIIDVLALLALLGYLLGVAGLVLLAARRDARRGGRPARLSRRGGRHRRLPAVAR